MAIAAACVAGVCFYALMMGVAYSVVGPDDNGDTFGAAISAIISAVVVVSVVYLITR